MTSHTTFLFSRFTQTITSTLPTLISLSAFFAYCIRIRAPSAPAALAIVPSTYPPICSLHPCCSHHVRHRIHISCVSQHALSISTQTKMFASISRHSRYHTLRSGVYWSLGVSPHDILHSLILGVSSLSLPQCIGN
ncbi:hypothetical protein PILCRDRAFT_623453 [Piloderma croceum F 1598]|uniref:Uncharacterized protein n=1 Tax=Piloderma croceum (strain F 1598) TaxID=765440 RepID=A0A0C3FC54_PILCF|nr:hypothetical protein PILCRDRAFT_623453 [Piloderma croceum F 1598]